MTETATKTDKPETKTESDPLGAALRQVLTIAGAFSLLGLIKDLLTWQHDLGLWIDAFRAFTRPIATFLFGWIPALFHLNFPGWTKDYLVLSMISAGAVTRAGLSTIKWHRPKPPSKFIVFIGILGGVYLPSIMLWPLLVVSGVLAYHRSNAEDRRWVRVCLSVYVYAILIIALNYAFIAGGARTGG